MTLAGLAATALKVNPDCCSPASARPGRGSGSHFPTAACPRGEQGRERPPCGPGCSFLAVWMSSMQLEHPQLAWWETPESLLLFRAHPQLMGASLHGDGLWLCWHCPPVPWCQLCLCPAACAPGSFGPSCSQRCRCQRGGSCDPVHGACSCPAGFYGTSCEHGKVTAPLGLGTAWVTSEPPPGCSSARGAQA